ncbi:uridine diphosphate glucose pyrophosphatase NUDT14 [Tribolium castaneum]|uniref:Uridine diphosphate glucose pyrophosphatase NUDT14 n=1 Tax=Tribolium castaneum TaxID=7070 RepID=D2A0B4_TRICA|nr:PREDICTED: uridine diphosphate glucose pyrophosphatase [Tribolium castaneum]EFA01723.1 Uridine diphosphate glucose pyrophosphatase-like Protein [Tribolium castaneum]|eukprot:XP_015834685.1 PREDICTED: uridine diphosphate glucose pyrophosphatase [Tribolium castaneum]
MNKISDVVLKPLEKSIYVKPQTMHFVQNGRKRTWDLLDVHDSVAILLHNTRKQTLIFVKQFRPPVYFGSIPEEDRKGTIDVNKYPAELGITLEMCAGLVDKDKPLVEIAKEEILEECGYDVPLSSLVKVGSYRSGVGTLGSLQTTYYCEVTDDMKVSQGGGVGDEIIDVVEMTVPEVKKYITQDKIPSPPSFLFAVYWFLLNKVK